jgi:hypothetical protein
MSVKSGIHNVQDGDRRLHSSKQQTLPFLSNCSPLTSCQYPQFEDAHHRPPKPMNTSPVPSNAACNLCIDEAPSSTTCQISDGKNCDWSSVCIDPDCSESICDECCQDCVEDCGSDCGVALGCDGVDLRSNDYYTCEGSFSELFGDQAVGLFDLDGRLPQLPIDTVPAEFIDFGPFPDDADAATSTLTEHVVPESTLDPNYEQNTSWIPTQLRPQSELPEAAKAANLDGVIASVLEPYFGYNSSQYVSVDAEVAAEGTKSTKSTPTSPSSGSSHDERIIAASLASTNTNTTSSARCQWADLNGQPCGRVFALGDDLHGHLKAAHGVKSEVMCRWIGCRVAIHGASPHQYANSVERHTWGHSGYRPYKCPTCSEGFAAAKLRDEHFTSLHLGKKTFCCDVCSHQCTSATNLKRHKDDKHRTGRFQCEFCNRNGKRRLFPRGPNLARHFRKCKCVLAQFPEAINAATGKMDDDWLPPGYKRGHHGMDRARVVPPNFLPLPTGN